MEYYNYCFFYHGQFCQKLILNQNLSMNYSVIIFNILKGNGSYFKLSNRLIELDNYLLRDLKIKSREIAACELYYK